MEELSFLGIKQHLSLLCLNQKFSEDYKSDIFWLPCIICLLPEGMVVYEKYGKVQDGIINVGVDMTSNLI